MTGTCAICHCSWVSGEGHCLQLLQMNQIKCNLLLRKYVVWSPRDRDFLCWNVCIQSVPVCWRLLGSRELSLPRKPSLELLPQLLGCRVFCCLFSLAKGYCCHSSKNWLLLTLCISIVDSERQKAMQTQQRKNRIVSLVINLPFSISR